MEFVIIALLISMILFWISSRIILEVRMYQLLDRETFSYYRETMDRDWKYLKHLLILSYPEEEKKFNRVLMEHPTLHNLYLIWN